jgi:malate permease and related proteins
MSMAIAESLAVLLILIGAGVALRQRGVIREADGPTLAKLITDLILPALVFSSLSRHSFELDRLMPGLIMLATTLFLLVFSWWIGRCLAIESKRLGAFILIAGVGSSSTLGYTLVGQIFPGNVEAAFTAVTIGEIGVILPLFLVGAPIAIHFGDYEHKAGAHGRELQLFLRSPLFIAMILGIGFSIVGIRDNPNFAPFYRALGLLSSALPVFVALSIGLMLRPVSIQRTWGAIAAVLGIKLILEPLMVLELATLEHMAMLERNVLVIEAAMPSGTIAAIIATRYGCDGGFASVLVVVSYAASLLTIPLIATLSSW